MLDIFYLFLGLWFLLGGILFCYKTIRDRGLLNSLISCCSISLIALLIIGGWLLLFGGWSLLSETYKQTCLGLFEDKKICERNREKNLQGKYCVEKSWDTCSHLKLEASYYECVEEEVCDCLYDNNIKNINCDK